MDIDQSRPVLKLLTRVAGVPDSIPSPAVYFHCIYMLIHPFLQYILFRPCEQWERMVRVANLYDAWIQYKGFSLETILRRAPWNSRSANVLDWVSNFLLIDLLKSRSDIHMIFNNFTTGDQLKINTSIYIVLVIILEIRLNRYIWSIVTVMFMNIDKWK